MARIAMSRSADGATIIALLPPSSRIGRPNRAATFGPTTEPMRVEPVAETIGTRFDATSASPIAGAADDELGEAFAARRGRSA